MNAPGLSEHITGGGGIQLPAGRTAVKFAKPLVQLARDSDVSTPHTITDTARDTQRALISAGAQLYRRDTVILYPDPSGKPVMQTMTPQIFRSWVNDRLHYFIYSFDKEQQRLMQKIKTISTSEAETILVSHAFWPHLPEIRRTHPIPMPVLRPGGKLEMLPIGYDAPTQIYTFKT